ncbi:hypothetical protein ACH5RR_012150 [Cinchona calisaya]|uniref:Phytocyanin domain-containing protein n=1 Tax=Cinchona calisaya TaxID=153742 RepID=A0ABD3A8G3_9GENT
MELTKTVVISFFLMVILGNSTANVYQVGGSTGWTINTGYKNWTSDQIFHVGDIIIFQYNAQYQNVLQVNREDYNSSKAKSALATYTTGNDLINLTSAGDYYYISSFPHNVRVASGYT